MPGWLDRLRHRRDPSAARVPPQETDLAALMADGNRLLESGCMSDAEARYAEACRRYPTAVAAAVNLGYIRLQQGRLDDASDALEHALRLDAGNIDALLMLGTIALERGEAPVAVERLEATLRLRPGFAPAFAPLVRALVAVGRHDAARLMVHDGLHIDPHSAELHFLRGNLMRIAEAHDAAIGAYRAALAAEPRLLEARIALATLLIDAGEFGEAREHLEQALAQRPPSAKLCAQLGDGLLALGLVDSACVAYGMALTHDPRHAPTLQNLNIAESLRGRLEAAREAARKVTEVAPERVEGWQNLGATLEALGQLTEAENCLQHARALSPENARSHTMLATVALRRGDTQQALEGFEQALSLDPESEVTLSHYLFALSYVDDPQRYLEVARTYGQLVTALARQYVDWPATMRTTAPLRVGLVSGDLRAHPIGYFVESVLPHLFRQGIEIVAFPTGAHDDAVTRRLKSHCAGWVPLPGLSDAAAAARIREEVIHVLLDLDGHGGRSRLPVFAWRPAPVQASWLGYWASTGVPAIDFLIADPYSVPEGQGDLYTEAIWTLPDTRLCFTVPAEPAAFPVGPLPARRDGHLTFGCFQNLCKVGDPVLAAWRSVLDALPDARLRLQCKQIGQDGAEQVRQRIARAGIDVERIILAPPTPRSDYLNAYGEVDLMLDSFPFPGGTTTCEALWMGVPTVTLAGRSMVANQGRSILANAGLTDWVAEDIDGYVALAIRKATDLDALATLRAGLRDRALASPLFDARRFANHLADALRGMWAQRSAR